MPLSGDTLHVALAAVRAVGKQHRPLDEIAAGANAALAAAPAGLSVDGAAAYLATCGQESAYWRTTTEYDAGGKYYAPYVGRGYVQVTHRDNYLAFGKWAHDRGLLADPQTFVRTPTLLADVRWAWLTASWYFDRHDLWRWGNRGDFYAVSQGVNRGPGAIGGPKVPSHWPERDAMYQALRAAGSALLPAAGGDPAGARRRRQQALLT